MNDAAQSLNEESSGENTPAGEIKKMQDLLNQSLGAVHANASTIETIKSQAETRAKEIQGEHDGVQNKIKELNKSLKELEGLSSQLEQIKSEAEQSQKDVEAHIKFITDTKAGFETLKTDTDEEAAELQTAQTNLQEKINEINTSHAAIKKLYDQLLVDTKDSEGNVITSSIKVGIDTLHKKIQEQFTAIDKKYKSIESEFKTLHENLESEIRSLLPGAGAAGLASGYLNSKGRYGTISYEPENKNMHWFPKASTKIFHFTINNISTIFNYILFLAPLILIFDLFVGKFFFEQGVNINAFDEKVILFRSLISAPLLFISLFGLSSIRLNRRLYEEYNHKQRVMQLYHSFKEKIDNEGDDEQKKKLLDIMLKVVNDKPSLIMPKYDGGGFWSFLKSYLARKPDPAPSVG